MIMLFGQFPQDGAKARETAGIGKRNTKRTIVG